MKIENKMGAAGTAGATGTTPPSAKFATSHRSSASIDSNHNSYSLLRSLQLRYGSNASTDSTPPSAKFASSHGSSASTNSNHNSCFSRQHPWAQGHLF